MDVWEGRVREGVVGEGKILCVNEGCFKEECVGWEREMWRKRLCFREQWGSMKGKKGNEKGLGD